MDIYASYDLIVSNENIFMKKLYKPSVKEKNKINSVQSIF